MVSAMDEPSETFLNADGTGVGKTRQALAFAKTMADRGHAVLIIAPNEVLGKPWEGLTFGKGRAQITGSYADDAKAMGIPVTLIDNLGHQLKPGEISVTTFHRLDDIFGKVNDNTVLIVDEAHNAKNYYPEENKRKTSGQSIKVVSMAQRARGVAYMSATPADTPVAIQYLNARGVLNNMMPDGYGIYTEPMRNLLDFLGYEWDQKVTKKREVVTTWILKPGLTKKEAAHRMDLIFRNLTSAGNMVKREISLEGVDINVKRVVLDPEAKALDDRIQAFFDGNERSDDGEFSSSASRSNPQVVLGHRRRAQEPYKIPVAVESAKAAYDAGKQIVIFADRVNDSEIGKNILEGFTMDGDPVYRRAVLETTEGTMRKLKEALVESGIPEREIAEMHGNSETGAAEAMRQFQSGEARVVIATMASGGTGINLDDRVGNAPRKMIILTPPFSALQNMQALGRTWRLSTKSFPDVEYIFANTEIDKWNSGILAKKLESLGAVVQGEVGKVSAEIDPDMVQLSDFRIDEETTGDMEKPEGVTYTIKKGYHTKKNHDIWIVNADQRLSREAYESELARAKAHGGYYSTYSGARGYIFQSAEEAEAFAGGKQAHIEDIGNVAGNKATGQDLTFERWKDGEVQSVTFKEGQRIKVYDYDTGEYHGARITSIDSNKGRAYVAIDGQKGLKRVDRGQLYTEDYAVPKREKDLFTPPAMPSESLEELTNKVKKGGKIDGYFPTPEKVVSRMIDELGITPGETVLEPSAGSGHIADAVRKAGGKVDVAEKNLDLQKILVKKGHNLVSNDAMKIEGHYDKIVMNPPFENGMDMDHVMKAYNKNLKPGGRLVAIMGEGAFFRGDKQSALFRKWLEVNGGISERLPEGTFKESDVKTGVNTRLVIVDKPDIEMQANAGLTPGDLKSAVNTQFDPQAHLKQMQAVGNISDETVKKVKDFSQYWVESLQQPLSTVYMDPNGNVVRNPGTWERIAGEIGAQASDIAREHQYRYNQVVQIGEQSLDQIAQLIKSEKMSDKDWIDLIERDFDDPKRKSVGGKAKEALDLHDKLTESLRKYIINSMRELGRNVPDNWGITEKGYFRHLFLGDFRIVDPESGRILDTARTYFEAASKAQNLAMKGQDVAIRAKQIVGDPTLRITDRRFWGITNELGKTLSNGYEIEISGSDIASDLRGIIGRNRNKTKFAGYAQQRLGASGYKKVYREVMGIHVLQVARTQELSKLNRSLTPIIEKLEKIQPGVADEMKGWLENLWGTPSKSDVAIARVIEKYPGIAQFVGNPTFAFKRFTSAYQRFMNLMKIRYNLKSISAQMVQPWITLYPRIGELGMAKVTGEFVKPGTWRRLHKMGVVDAEYRMANDTVTYASGGLKSWLSNPFAKMSDVNRALGYLAGEQIGARFGLTGEELHINGLMWAEITEFDNSLWNAAVVQRGSMGRTITQYKGYLFKSQRSHYEIWKNYKGKGVTRLVMAQLAAGGLKSFGMYLLPLSLLMQDEPKEAVMQWLDEHVDSEELKEMLMLGIPAITGGNFSNSVNLMNEPFGDTAAEQIMNFGGGPALSLLTSIWDYKARTNEIALKEDWDDDRKAEALAKANWKLASALSPYAKQIRAIADVRNSPREYVTERHGKEVPMITEFKIQGRDGKWRNVQLTEHDVKIQGLGFSPNVVDMATARKANSENDE